MDWIETKVEYHEHLTFFVHMFFFFLRNVLEKFYPPEGVILDEELYLNQFLIHGLRAIHQRTEDKDSNALR